MNDHVDPHDESEQPGHRAPGEEASGDEHLHAYAGGDILERPGVVNKWLLIVYFALFAWSLYYLFSEWRGLGPGLGY